MLRDESKLPALRNELYEIACKQDVDQFIKYVYSIKSEFNFFLFDILNVEKNPIDLLIKNGKSLSAKFLIVKFYYCIYLVFGSCENDKNELAFMTDIYMRSLREKLIENDPELTEVTIFFSEDYGYSSTENPFIQALSKNTSLVVLNFGFDFFNDILKSNRLQERCEEIFKTLETNHTIKELNFSLTDRWSFNNFLNINKNIFLLLLECNTSLISVSLPMPLLPGQGIDRTEIESAIEIYTNRNKIYAIWNVFEKIKNLLTGISDEDSSLLMFPIELIGVISSLLTSFFLIPNSELTGYAKQFYSSYSPRNEITFWNTCRIKRREIYICDQIKQIVKKYKELNVEIFDVSFKKDEMNFSCYYHQTYIFRNICLAFQIEYSSYEKCKRDNIIIFKISKPEDIQKFFTALEIPELQMKNLMEYICNLPEQKTMRNFYQYM